jgi:hypothetical protein
MSSLKRPLTLEEQEMLLDLLDWVHEGPDQWDAFIKLHGDKYDWVLEGVLRDVRRA